LEAGAAAAAAAVASPMAELRAPEALRFILWCREGGGAWEEEGGGGGGKKVEGGAVRARARACAILRLQAHT